jgi:hypothetical protein
MNATKARALELIREGAKKHNGIRHTRGYADGSWGMQVSGIGRVTFHDYAAEHYAPGTPLEQLIWLDLGALLGELDGKL